MFVDSHCHLDRLDLSKFDDRLEGALKLAADEGIDYFLCVCIDLEHFDDVLSPAKQHNNIFASVGVHPNEQVEHEADTDALIELSADDRVIAIGETGLDYFRSEGDLEWQRDRFRTHINAAKQTEKPLIIHMRDATEDTLQILKEESAEQVGGVMHCFVEDWEVARRAMDLNFYISFSGIVTFNSAKELKNVAKLMPLDRMLIETDSPYLAPVPFRGKPNQPAYVRYVAEHIAELRGIPVEQVGEQTTDNFFNLFRHARR